MLTVFSLKVSMTLSAPSLDAKTISTMMNGFVFTMRQSSISPPIGVMALSTSAAVVPGAKFCAMTVKGPASPRIDMPCGGARTLTCCWTVWSTSMRSSAAARRAFLLLALLAAGVEAAAGPAPATGLPPAVVMRAPSDDRDLSAPLTVL